MPILLKLYAIKLLKILWGYFGPAILAKVTKWALDKTLGKFKKTEVKNAVENGSTVEIEKALGTSNAGLPSRHNITELRTERKEDAGL